MKAKIFQASLLMASIFAVSNIAYAETVSIDPLAAESYSKEFNVSIQEAERRLTIVSQLDLVTQKLNDQFGDSIASVYFDNGQDFKLVVRTTKKGKTQREVMDLTSELSKAHELPIEVIANSPRNFKAIQNIIANQGNRIGRQYDGFQMTAYDPQKDAIYIAFYQPNIAKQNEIKSKLNKVSGMDVVLDFMKSPITNTAVIGGGNLQFSNTIGGWCTAGFTGTMNNTLGVLTATHCVNGKVPAFYGDANSIGNKYTLGKPITPNSIEHEISFLPVNTNSINGEVYQYLSGIGNNQLYKNNLKIRGFAFPKYAMSYNYFTGESVGGTQLCHVGQTTGFSCGVVTQVNGGVSGCNASAVYGKANSDCAQSGIIVRGKTLKVKKGDSGGPFFDSSGLAYGIMSAGNDETGIVSPITPMINAGFTLKTGY